MAETKLFNGENHVLEELTSHAQASNLINPELFTKYAVKRGLRDLDGRGVLVGLTEIGEVHSYIMDEGEIIPVAGRLIYRGIDINDITKGYINEKRYGFEETTYLLLFGHLPSEEELTDFQEIGRASCRERVYVLV